MFYLSFQITGSILRIPSAQVKDRGIYYCKATNEGGTGQSSAIIDIERMYSLKSVICVIFK